MVGRWRLGWLRISAHWWVVDIFLLGLVVVTNVIDRTTEENPAGFLEVLLRFLTKCNGQVMEMAKLAMTVRHCHCRKKHGFLCIPFRYWVYMADGRYYSG